MGAARRGRRDLPALQRGVPRLAAGEAGVIDVLLYDLQKRAAAGDKAAAKRLADLERRIEAQAERPSPLLAMLPKKPEKP